MRVLIVDDSSTMRRIMLHTLTKLGYTDVVQASNGREALAQLGAGPIDMIVTDWSMPEMDGIELVRTVRTRAATRQIPVVMVTGNGARRNIVEALKAGVDSYVLKPFTSDTMRAQIHAVLNR